MQGRPEGTCWLDSEGNEIDELDIDVFGGGAASSQPTLVLDTNYFDDEEEDIIKTVGEDELVPFVCKVDIPESGGGFISHDIKFNSFFSFVSLECTVSKDRSCTLRYSNF